MESVPANRNLVWELVGSREDRSYRLFSVAINTNRSPRTGETHEFQVLKSPDWVAVVALTPKNEMILVRQYRHGTSELSLEPPGGLVKEGQSPEQSGREELEEETGYRAESFELLGWMHPMPALFTNRFYVYLATDATPEGRLNPDETEEVETVLVPVEQVKHYVRSGTISCGIMIAALHLFFDWEDRKNRTSP
jgi:ADP-ribose pyrophosphatase